MASKDKKIPKPSPDSIKHKKTPIEDKNFKKGDRVYWIGKVNGVLRRYEGRVELTVAKGRTPKNFLSRSSKAKFFTDSISPEERVKKRPRRSYVVSVPLEDGKYALYWPKLSRLEEVI